MLGYALDMIEWYSGKNEDKSRLVSNWLKSLKDRVVPQPKQEWSEEDIVAIDCAVEVLSKDLPSLAASIERLKSLRPHPCWKPNEGQLSTLRDCAIFIKNNGGETGLDDYKDLMGLYNELITEPQSHWKPSDEQMMALKDACDEHWEPDGLDPLYTLYQDLKKLREE